MNEKKVDWVPEREWWYRREFELSSEIIEKQIVELVFEWLDTSSTIWINGVEIAETNHMFILGALK